MLRPGFRQVSATVQSETSKCAGADQWCQRSVHFRDTPVTSVSLRGLSSPHSIHSCLTVGGSCGDRSCQMYSITGQRHPGQRICAATSYILFPFHRPMPRTPKTHRLIPVPCPGPGATLTNGVRPGISGSKPRDLIRPGVKGHFVMHWPISFLQTLRF